MISLAKDSTESRVLAWLRFPLAAMIVLLHTDFPDDRSTVVYYVAQFLSCRVTHIAVPTFFFMSGYLFFAKFSEFGWREYTAVMRRKVVTLLFPYLLWISFAYYGYGLLKGYDVVGGGK